MRIFDHYVDTFDIGIFNLGYLPEGDHNITTTLDVTQRTLIKAVEHMKKGHLYNLLYWTSSG